MSTLLRLPKQVVSSAVATAAQAEQVVFTAAMNLPEPVQRRLAGRPVRIDGQTLATDTQLMLKLAKVAGPAVETLPIDKGRIALLRQTLLAGGTQPIGEVSDHRVTGHRARLYVPSSVDTTQPGPLLVFFHGGGFIYGDLESHDAGCRFLAEQSGVRVLSVEYRMGPLCPFPAAYDDAVAAFVQVLARAEEFGAEPGRIGVGGDSAGGNLAASVALAAKERCAFQLLIYPVVQFDERTRSRELFNRGFFLTEEFITVAGDNYLSAGTDPRDPRLAPLHAEVPDRVAPAYVCTAGFDPLRDEGEAYAEKLRAAGVKTELRRFPDQIHGFFNVVGAGRTAKAAATEVASALRTLAG